MRILHLHAGNLYGGVETLLVTLAKLRHLCPAMDPHFALCFEGRLSQELASAGVPVHLLGRVRISQPWTAWRARRRLRELLRREHYDAVICHMPWPLVVFGRTARAEGQKLAFWAHSAHSGESRLERMARRITPDLAIANSGFVGASLANLYPDLPAPVMHYPVALVESSDTAQRRTAARRELGVDDDTVVIIQVSRFEAWKGHLLHLDALSRLKSRNWVCWMVGGPQNPADQRQYDQVRAAADRLGIADRVRFLGQRSDVPQLLAGADIFCQPNEGPEPFGIVFVEALWAARPVVTTAMGGALEILDESCGVLAEPDSPASLARALDRLIESPELRSRLGKAGPARARHLCDPATQMNVLEELVREAPSVGTGAGAASASARATAPWVLVAGGFHRHGGMDKANLALAQYLAEQGTPVHLVCFSIDADLARHPLVTVHIVSRPANSYFLGRPLLDFTGRRIARRVSSRWPQARVLVNGDNCLWPGINWVHYVHHAWDEGAPEGPLWFRAKERLSRWLVRRRERSAARAGRLFITNSNRTSRDLTERLGVDARRVHTIYLGAESEWGPVTREEKAAARKAFNIPESRPVAVFIGSIGHDRRKGFDVLLEAWRRLCADPQWDVDLVVAGSGSALGLCREQVAQWKLDHRIRLLGFSDRVRDLLAAADVLVSPVRYEAYGLNVQEAICRGVPAIVSSAAGVAERYGPECAPLLLPDPQNIDDLIARLRQWRSNMPEWGVRFELFGDTLRRYGWQDMARRMVSLASQFDTAPPESSRSSRRRTNRE